MVLLLDERFLQRAYRELFPLEWQDYEICTVQDAGERIKRFWEIPEMLALLKGRLIMRKNRNQEARI